MKYDQLINKQFHILQRNKTNKDKDKFIDNTSDGFELAQEKIIKCYDKDIKNISVAKGYRATYEEYKETHKTK